MKREILPIVVFILIIVSAHYISAKNSVFYVNSFTLSKYGFASNRTTYIYYTNSVMSGINGLTIYYASNYTLSELSSQSSGLPLLPTTSTVPIILQYYRALTGWNHFDVLYAKVINGSGVFTVGFKMIVPTTVPKYVSFAKVSSLYASYPTFHIYPFTAPISSYRLLPILGPIGKIMVGIGLIDRSTGILVAGIYNYGYYNSTNQFAVIPFPGNAVSGNDTVNYLNGTIVTQTYPTISWPRIYFSYNKEIYESVSIKIVNTTVYFNYSIFSVPFESGEFVLSLNSPLKDPYFGVVIYYPQPPSMFIPVQMILGASFKKVNVINLIFAGNMGYTSVCKVM